MTFFRVLLIGLVWLALGAGCNIVSGETPNKYAPLFTIIVKDESDLPDNLEKEFGIKVMTIPTFWKRKFIELECLGKLKDIRLTRSERGRSHQKFLGITLLQREKFGTAINKNYELLENMQFDLASDFSDGNINNNRVIFNFWNEILHNIVVISQTNTTILNSVLTKEQIQRMRELELVIPPIIDTGLAFSINFDAYEALELLQEQRDKLMVIKLQHSKLQDKVALSEANIPSPFIYQDSTDNLSLGEKRNYTERKLAQKKELKKEVEKFKSEYQDAILKILNQQQRDKLEKLRREIPPKLTVLRAEALKELAEEDAAQ
jgi:hypothetical protein